MYNHLELQRGASTLQCLRATGTADTVQPGMCAWQRPTVSGWPGGHGEKNLMLSPGQGSTMPWLPQQAANKIAVLDQCMNRFQLHSSLLYRSRAHTHLVHALKLPCTVRP